MRVSDLDDDEEDVRIPGADEEANRRRKAVSVAQALVSRESGICGRRRPVPRLASDDEEIRLPLHFPASILTA